jgi:hypothetical protein
VGLGVGLGVGVGFGVGVGVGAGVAVAVALALGAVVGPGDELATGITVMVTLTVVGLALTPDGVTMRTVTVVVEVRPFTEMVSVGIESSVFSRS